MTRPVNAGRKARDWARAYGSAERVSWVRLLPCIVRYCPRGPCENAHTESGGIGRKADARTVVPACSVHHTEIHHYGIRSFEKLHGLDLAERAAATERDWLAYSGEALL